jgi:arylsulfatase A-like enzyme
MTRLEQRIVRRLASCALAGALLSIPLGLISCRASPPAGWDLVRAAKSSPPSGLPSDFHFSAAPSVSDLEVDSERRPVAIATLSTWSWRGRVPDGAHLHVGGQLVPEAWRRAPGLEITVSAVQGSVREILDVARADPAAPQRWVDLDVDLTAYAGKRIALDFTASTPSPAGNTALPRADEPVMAWGPVVLAVRDAAPRPNPNVLFILVDTLRADHLPAYGYARDTAPNIQRFLAERGTVVDTAYSQAPWTMPSVISFLTSREPGEILSGRPTGFALPPGIETLGERLSRLGYRSAGFYANYILHAGIGFDRGFETFYCPPGTSSSMFLHAESVTSRAESWLRAHQEEPFFLYLHLIDPHDPYDNPEIVGNRSPFETEPYTGRVAGSWIHGISQGRIHLDEPVADRAHITALYDSEIHYADRYLGRLFATLRPEVLANTLVVLTADHGEELGDHGSWKHGQTLYQEMIRVPLLMRWDGHIPAGGRLAGTVRLLDLLPTLNAAAGGKPDAAWQGIDLLPALLGRSPVPRQPAFAETLSSGPARASVVVDGKKLVLFNRRSPFVPEDELQERLWRIDLARLARAELYDLAADAGEHTNLAEREPEARATREQAILRQLDRELPGMRVILSGLPAGRRVSGSIDFDTPPVRWSSYFLGDTDHVTLEGSRLHFDVLGDGLDKGVIVEGDFQALRKVESAIDGGGALALSLGGGLGASTDSGGNVPLARLAVNEMPAATAGPSMRIWIAAARGAKSALTPENAETLKRLRALGYVQ